MTPLQEGLCSQNASVDDMSFARQLMHNEVFLNRLPTFSVHHGKIPQNFHIRVTLKNGYVSVIDGKPIPFSMMK